MSTREVAVFRQTWGQAAAPVHNRVLFFFSEETVKCRIVTCGNYQRVDWPLEAIDFNVAILDYTQVHLNKVFLVLEYFITEMDAATCNT